MCLTRMMREALASEGLPENAINLVEDTSRETATQMMKLNGYLDVLIPRGGAGLIRSVVMNATVPVIETGTGNCHVYVDRLPTSKWRRASLSTPSASARAVQRGGKPARAPRCRGEIPADGGGGSGGATMLPSTAARARPKSSATPLLPATDEDYGREYLGYEISCKVVDSLDEAIDHINRFNTGHSRCIVTRDYDASQRFLEEVDAAAVYVNASTRFTDGFEFGFGAEIGISTRSCTHAARWD